MHAHWRSIRRDVLRGALLLCVAFSMLAIAQSDTLIVGAFSTATPGAAQPEHWQPLTIKSAKAATRYTVVDDGGTTVLRAEADTSASGLIRRMTVNPREYPLLKWRWKANNIVRTGNVYTREGDDYPARIYVMFDYPLEKLPFGERMRLRMARAFYDPDLPAATLCYVWDAKAPVGTIVASAYTNRVRLIVVESGESRVNQWLTFERDVAADFRAVFGEEPPAISAVALATDTDNTGASVTAFYGDISFNKQIVNR